MLETIVKRLRGADRVVVFTGAGVSAESGIPTFRDALTGLWENFDASRLATAEAFRSESGLGMVRMAATKGCPYATESRTYRHC